MRMRLKDRAFQEKLDELTDGDFSKGLAEAMSKGKNGMGLIDVDCGEPVNHFVSVYLQVPRFHISFRESEIEAEYDPHDWNEYPAVTPPEGVWMRVEVANSECGYKAKFEDGRWLDGRGVEIFGEPGDKLGPLGRPVRFRPWGNAND